MSVAINHQKIKNNIIHACRRVDRQPEEVTMIGVTKYVDIKRANEVVDVGISHLAENRLEGFLDKYDSLPDDITWHFIGSLQSRKVKDLINKVDYIHSLDRKSLAKEINKRAEKVIPCFVQVNVSGEESKHGLKREDTLSFVESLSAYPNIKVVGLMTMAPHVDDEQLLRDTFRKLREIRDEIKGKEWVHAPCAYLSMGMSNDYEIAIEEGATHIRIGSTLVGSN